MRYGRCSGRRHRDIPIDAPPAEGSTVDVPPATDSRPRLEDRFGQALSLSRIFVIVPVIVLLLSAWLRMNDLNDLKARVISMIILVAAVTFVDAVIESRDGLDTLYVGAGIALVIAALTGFLHFGRTDGNNR